MSNISVTTICNRRCEYCFAGDSRSDVSGSNFISMETFHDSIAYLKRSKITQLRILGGEPTLHPQFCQMVDTGIQKGFNVLIFSNGVMSKNVLNHLIKYNARQLTLLINTIDPSGNDQTGILNQQNTLETLEQRVKLGVNIYKREQQLDFLIDYIIRFNLNKEIRFGIAQPLLSRKNAYLHPKFYEEIGIKIFRFYEKAEVHGIRIGFDCGFVPCMFPSNSFKKLKAVLPHIGKSCNPIPDLMPDGNFISCYPLNNLRKIKLNACITSNQLVEIFNHNLSFYSGFGIYPHCRDCDLFGNYCSGGCVSLKIHRLRTQLQNQHLVTGSKSTNALSKLQKVLDTFDITQREPPKPYKPAEKSEILTESELLSFMKLEKTSNELSIYIHIPFCRTKCAFCDLYSFPLNKNNDFYKELYVRSLITEIELWGQFTGGKYSHVTTIHFGGGSPLQLPHQLLIELINTLKRYFPIDHNTEMAIEVTTDELNDENIGFLNRVNITRIHVGIQTLNTKIREMIGRSDSLTGLDRKIARLLDHEAIISADVLFGMPNHSENVLLTDINQLIQMGFDGFALYEFQPSKFIKRTKETATYLLPNKYENIMMLNAAKESLNNAGYRNVFFNHYGNSRDKNLYFTYLDRSEDCIALGTISDGVVNRINFRHKIFNAYIKSLQNNEMGLDFGYLEPEDRIRKKQMETALMSSRLLEGRIKEFNNFYGNRFSEIFHGWMNSGLIEKSGDGYVLTAGGCYLISNMIDQIRSLKTEI